MDPGFASFDKLQEVGVSPYLCFIPILSVFRCFDWLEALNGHLIGHKSWDRIDLILLTQYEMAVGISKKPGARGPLWARPGPMGFSPVQAREAQARPEPVKGRAGPWASFQARPGPVGRPES